MYDIVLCFITSFLLTYFAIPSIINIAAVKKLVDVPDERRSHEVPTPSLGGIGIFGGLLFSIILWTPFALIGDLQYILCSAIIIFLIGAKDDILPTSAMKKMLGQLFAAGILVFKANVMITSLYGIFGIYELPYWIAAIFSLFIILVIINSFNLIDGINGLAASLGVLVTFLLGIWFWAVAHTELSLVAFAMTGALVAFLKYNLTPARIFMGDTGSLLVGLIVSILVIKFIEIHRISPDSIYAVKSAPAIAIALIIYPLFDTLRVFTMRIINKKSPFSPDRRHLHHGLLDLGLSHMQATFILIVFTIEILSIALFLQNIGSFYLILVILGLSMGFAYLIRLMVANRQRLLSGTDGVKISAQHF
jgi:UDP-N-acetylmuramyl pentapeptide phosphotransferase/UDP-N-acetylglucosamine-1-phosphate transferase